MFGKNKPGESWDDPMKENDVFANKNGHSGLRPNDNVSPFGSPVNKAVSPSTERSNRVEKVETVIGKNSRVEGDLYFSNGLHILGHVRGNLVSEDEETLVVGESAHIEGEVRVANIVVNGTIDGDVYASGRIRIFESARTNGDIYYSSLEVAEGAVLNGRMIKSSGLAEQSEEHSDDDDDYDDYLEESSGLDSADDDDQKTSSNSYMDENI